MFNRAGDGALAHSRQRAHDAKRNRFRCSRWRRLHHIRIVL